MPKKNELTQIRDIFSASWQSALVYALMIIVVGQVFLFLFTDYDLSIGLIGNFIAAIAVVSLSFWLRKKYPPRKANKPN